MGTLQLAGDWDPTYDSIPPMRADVKKVPDPEDCSPTQVKERVTTGDHGETPKGRPLPTLREIHQINLRRAMEEEQVDTPCDICGSLDHDYRHCRAGAHIESQDLRLLSREVQPQCQNCDKGHPGQCPCGWCGEKGHISTDCPTKYYSQSMKECFPKRKRAKRVNIMEYTCTRCGEKHPFNRYCPYAIDPPNCPRGMS